MITLRIALNSALCSGSGMGRAGAVDRDVVFTREGLPLLPGRRLKGLLRDAYEQLRHSKALPGLPDTDDIFGEIGTDFSGQVCVGDGRLENFKDISAWLGNWLSYPQAPFLREHVMEAFTEVRRQTAIDRATGSPDEDTLRATRILRKGQTFVAAIEGLRTEHKAALALAAAAVQSMGASRTRGSGWVRCTIHENAIDITRDAIQKLREGKLEFGKIEQQNAGKGTIHHSGFSLRFDNEPTHVLQFRITLQQTALLPNMEGDPNTVFTERSIPGSTIRGLLGVRYLQKNLVDQTFYQLFCSGAVCFLSGNLVLQNLRSLPIPHSVRRLKSEPLKYLDLARRSKPKEPIRRVDGRPWCVLAGLLAEQVIRLEAAQVRTDFSYHHARPTEDNRVGHAVGTENAKDYQLDPEKAGALFTYECLAAGQTFAGAVIGSRGNLEIIKAIIPADENIVRIGRSKSAQYGGSGLWRWDGEIVDIDENGGETFGWAGKTDHPETSCQKVIVTLLSPMLPLNRLGHPTAEFPLPVVAGKLGLGVEANKIGIRAFSRTTWQGGYFTHQRLPRQQVPALATGSVFVLDLPCEVSSQQLRIVEGTSYGMRVEDGFGRISVRHWHEASEDRYFSLATPEQKEQAPTRMESKDHPAYSLACSTFEQHVRKYAAARAIEASGESRTHHLDRIKSHQISRLIQILENNTLEQFRNQIKKLKEPAQKQLRDCRVEDVGLGQFLLREMNGDSFARFVENVHGRGWDAVIAKDLVSLADKAEPIIKNYLLRYLGALAWRKRKTATNSQTQPTRTS